MSSAEVTLWGRTIAYISMDEEEEFGRFQWDPDFVDAGVELAPLQMPLGKGGIYQFRDLARHTFHGLPGLVADALPDKYGNALIDVWLASTGQSSHCLQP